MKFAIRIKNTDTAVTFPAFACHQIMWGKSFHHA